MRVVSDVSAATSANIVEKLMTCKSRERRITRLSSPASSGPTSKMIIGNTEASLFPDEPCESFHSFSTVRLLVSTLSKAS
jgi:hypothetical protein